MYKSEASHKALSRGIVYGSNFAEVSSPTLAWPDLTWLFSSEQWCMAHGTRPDLIPPEHCGNPMKISIIMDVL